MKKNFILHKVLFVPALFALLVACDGDDDGAATGPDFGSIASTHEEATAGTVTIPLRGVSNPESLDLTLGGSASEGEDYTVVGITEEGVQLSITDDSKFEGNETIRLQLHGSNGELVGNSTHTLTIVSNCEDTEGMDAAIFTGDYEAYERYGPDTVDWYGPYTVHFVADETDANTLTFDNLYDSGCDAFLTFDVDAGSVYFPDQAPCDEPLTNSSGTFTLDPCTGEAVLIIDLNFDGGDWTYSFRKL
jgi:hypothetical protein